MRPHTFCSVLATIRSFLYKTIPGLAALGLLLIFAARPASADTYKTFTVSITWLQAGSPPVSNPFPIDPTSTIVIDTTTGQVVSSAPIAVNTTNVTVGGGANTIAFQNQGPGTGFYVISFSGFTVDAAGDSIAVSFTLVLPVGSLVGYSGGPINLPLTVEVLTCSGANCTSTSPVAFTANTGQLTLTSTKSPVPLLNSLAPTATAPGGPAFTLSVIGGAFVPGSVVNWNGSARPTIYLGPDQLTAAITAADIASAGTVAITVTNSAPGGGTSNAQYFQITNPLTPTNFTTFGNNEIDAYRVRSSNTLVGDFNGDEKPDLVAYANGIIYFLPNNGDGTFTEGNWVASPGPPGFTGYLATADLNGDGKPDLIVVTTNGTFVALGNGNGTFHLLSTSLSDTPVSVVFGDFNGDGFLDLAYTTPGGGGPPPVSPAIQVQLGNGDGTFRTGPSTTLSTTPLPGTSFAPRLVEALAVDDFFRVGRLNLLALVTSNDCKAGLYTVLEFQGLGDGSFGSFPVVVPGTQTCGSQTPSVVVADFNGDGIRDVAYFTIEAGGFAPGPTVLNVALGSVDGTFRSVPFRVIEQIPANASSTNYGPVLAADLNGDGKLDLVTGNQIFYSNGDGSFTARGPAQNNGLQVVGLADFNGDGQVDLLALGQDPTNANMFDIRELLQVPAPADFGGGITPGAQTAVPGGNANYNGNVIALNGFTGNVALTASNLPSGVTASFNPTTVTGGSGSYTLTLNVGSGVALGTYTITVTGTSGSLVHSGAVTLIVNSSVGDFSASMASGSDSMQNINAGQTATYTVQITPIGGFTGNVALSVSGVPAGTTATFNPAVVTGGSGTSTLTVVTTASTPVNSVYTLTITAANGPLVHTGTVFLGVRNGGDFTGSITPNTQTIQVGQIATYSANITYLNGFNPLGTICLTISVSGLPAGAQLSISCAGGAGSGGETDTITVSAVPGTATGTYGLVITGSSAGRIRSGIATLIIN